ncbi:hypothetical protein LZ30DRAFT_752612 [Colletotrichum cereale]|nr:hypothetical protein LZ30DRAFT_752612 [Colletotrichum cereale]
MTTASFFRNVPPPSVANTCGFMAFPVTTLRFPVDEAIPLRCRDSRMPCGTSGSYKGCFETIPTTCRETSTLAVSCAPDEMCCGDGSSSTACWTWLSMDATRTFSLFICSTVAGTGTLMPDSTVARPTSGTDPSSTSDLPRTNTDATATASSAGTYSTPAASVATKTDLAVPGPTSQTPEEGGGGGGPSLGAAVGGIIGALALMSVFLGAALFVWFRARKKEKEKGKRNFPQVEAISPVTGPDGIIMVPYRSGTGVPTPPSYGGRPPREPESVASETARKPPRRPARSPERKINVTEGGWI